MSKIWTLVDDMCIHTDTMRPSDGMKAGLLLSLSLVCRVLKLISSWHFSWTWRWGGGVVSGHIQQRKQKPLKMTEKDIKALKISSTSSRRWWGLAFKYFCHILPCIFLGVCRRYSVPWVVCGHSGSLWSLPVWPAYHLQSSPGFGSPARGWSDGSTPAARGRQEENIIGLSSIGEKAPTLSQKALRVTWSVHLVNV